MTPGRQLRGKGLKLKELLKGSTDASGAINRGLVLPSAADFGYCAHNGVPRHVVVTPYVFDKKTGRVRNPGPGDEGMPRVEFELKRPDLVGDFEGNADVPVYKATVVISAGGELIDTQQMWSMRHPAIGDVVEPNAIPATWRSRTPGEAPPDVTRSTHKPDDTGAPTDPATTYTYPDRTKYVEDHGPEVVRWAEHGLDGSQAKALLADLPTRTLVALGDIPAKDAAHLVGVIGKDTIAKVVPPLTGGDVALEAKYLGEEGARRFAGDNTEKKGPSRLKRHAEGLSHSALEIDSAKALTSSSMMVDSNIVISIQKLQSGASWNTLQAGEKVFVNRIRKLSGLPELAADPPDRSIAGLVGHADLRTANIVTGEVGGTGMAIARPMSATRDTPKYAGVLSELSSPPPIGGSGQADKLVVADAVFAVTSDGSAPTLVSGDANVFARLAQRYLPPGSFKQKPYLDRRGVKKTQSVGAAVAEDLPDFTVEIPDGQGGVHRLRVIPVHPGDNT
ncbi:MAG: hypothetical protein IPL61_11040 [Myxococcales bacterium]|nr:hypothetical protein [Myxococcales bacterium]